MSPPRPEALFLEHHPIASLQSLDLLAGANNFGNTFIASYRDWVGSSEACGECRFGRVHALYLIDVCWVDWGREEAEGKEVRVRRRYGMRM